MRITCPNCGAEYEVEAAMIPDAGRDVQCSACGHTWMQFRDGRAEEIGTPSAPSPSDKTDEYDGEGSTGQDFEVPSDPPRRRMDDDTRRILREEAEREAKARRERRRKAEDAPLETQADLGLPEAASERRASAPADPKPASEPDPDAAIAMGAIPSEPRSGSRSDRLPDIEEINSTLDARPQDRAAQSDIYDQDDDDPGAETSDGFRGGFLMIVSLALIAIAVYLLAPRIASAVPALEPAMSAYVSAANDLRVAVEAMLQSAADAIGGAVDG